VLFQVVDFSNSAVQHSAHIDNCHQALVHHAYKAIKIIVTGWRCSTVRRSDPPAAVCPRCRFPAGRRWWSARCPGWRCRRRAGQKGWRRRWWRVRPRPRRPRCAGCRRPRRHPPTGSIPAAAERPGPPRQSSRCRRCHRRPVRQSRCPVPGPNSSRPLSMRLLWFRSRAR
jgi:hypothetical protein